MIASHAVPPHASFPTAPVSNRWIEEATVLRQTFFAVQDETLRLCSVIYEGAETGQKLSESFVELPNSTSTITHLDVLVTEKQKTLIAVQDDGTVTIASSDLKQISTSRLERSSDAGAPLTLLAACCLPLHEASKSVLRSRGDITKGLPEDTIVVLDLSMQDDPTTQRPIYSVWCLQPEYGPTITSSSTNSTQLLFRHDLWSWDLSPIRKTQETRVTFGTRASTLDIKTHKDYVRYQLGGTVPTRLLATQLDVTGAFDMVALDSSHILLAHATSLYVLDGRYGVAQATLDVKSTKKRKQPGADAPKGAIELITYFSQAQRVLAQIGTNLVAFDMRFSREPSGKQSRTSKLVRNVGQGRRVPSEYSLTHAAMCFTEPPTHLEPTWSEQKAKLEKVFLEKDATTLENTILRQLAPKSKKDRQQDHDGGQGPKFPRLFDATVDYVLTKIFTILTREQPDSSSSSSTILRVELVAPRLVEWLSSAGFLCIWSLRKAFGSQHERRILNSLSSRDLAQALYEADTSSNLLLVHIKHISNLPVEEQVGALKFLINLAKTNSEQNDSSKGKSSALVPANGILDHAEKLQIHSTTLSPALMQTIVLLMNQLGVLDQSVLSTHLREALSSEEITTSIQFLRQQLFRGGHASWLASNAPATDGEPSAAACTGEPAGGVDARLVSFECILTMLSACLNTIGPLQLLNAGKKDQIIESIIPELLSEVELSAHYIEESAELQGILRETLRYSQSRERKLRKTAGSMPGSGEKSHTIGEIVTVYSGHSEDEATSSLAGMLPLSLRDEYTVDAVRVRKGGGQLSERSKREMLALEGRQKGAYSFERLIL